MTSTTDLGCKTSKCLTNVVFRTHEVVKVKESDDFDSNLDFATYNVHDPGQISATPGFSVSSSTRWDE